MHSLYISFLSEFYKSKKTLAFWSAILLPLIICLLISLGFYTDSEKVLNAHFTPIMLWLRYLGAALGVMGFLILPFFVIFIAFSVNNIEHKNDTWKTLFAQPLNRFSIYTAKYLYAVSLLFISLLLFGLLTLGFGYLLQILVPKYNFNQYDPSFLLVKLYTKLFLASLGILSVQFILSLLWSDFLKPMGVGFVGTIIGLIASNAGWKYAYLILYAYPSTVLRSAKPVKKVLDPASIEIFSPEIYGSLIFAIVFFVLGYYIVTKKSIK